MRSEEDARRAIGLYADTVRRICFMHLKKQEDVEDAFQEIFLKYILNEKIFESHAHEKAWLIRVTVNVCRDMLKSPFRKRVCSIEDMTVEPFYIQEEEGELLSCIAQLQSKYRNVLYLFYYEGYSAVEIANIMHKKENTIYTWLNRARKALKEKLGGDPIG
jgi:RNA polymerase sigma-70 factor (ECF subfamily)